MSRQPGNKENVIPIPATYPCQKDIGARFGKRKAETNLGTQWMKENAAAKRVHYADKQALNTGSSKAHTSALGATSFAGIGDIIRQQENGVSTSRPIQQPGGIRTFADITTKHVNGPQQDPLVNSSSRLEELFSSSFSLQAEDMAGHFGKAPAVTVLQLPDEATALPSSSQAPFDWSLKTRVRFVSSEPFALAEEAACCSASAACSSVRSFCACDADGLKPLQEQYQAATMSWQHPETSYSPASLIALRRGHADLVQSRHSMWQHAFKGLYLAMRHGHCDFFYLSTPVGVHHQKQNIVLFGAAGIAGRPRLHAIVSRKQSSEAHQVPSDLAGIHMRPATTGREIDNTKESMLYFEGPIQVQGLFEYLYNESRRMCGEDADVPLLIAPAAFPAACLKQQTPKILAAAESAKGKVSQYRLDLRGTTPPWVLARLVAVLQGSQQAKFQMVAESEPLTGSFNLTSDCSSQPQVAPAAAWHTGGSMSESESELWRAPVGQLANLVVQDLVWNGETFATRLTKCSVSSL